MQQFKLGHWKTSVTFDRKSMTFLNLFCNDMSHCCCKMFSKSVKIATHRKTFLSCLLRDHPFFKIWDGIFHHREKQRMVSNRKEHRSTLKGACVGLSSKTTLGYHFQFQHFIGSLPLDGKRLTFSDFKRLLMLRV